MAKKDKKPIKKDEEQILLESVQNEPDPKDPAEETDKVFENVSIKDSCAHANVVNLIVCTIVVIFFGTVFVTLTNHQDFTDSNQFSIKNLLSGNYLARVESKFNESLPLQDYFHNASNAIKYCFGIGNDADFVEITSNNNIEDPYDVDIENDYVAIDDTQQEAADIDDGEEDSDEVVNEIENSEDDDKNKEIKGITLTNQSDDSEDVDEEEEEESETTVNTASPSATTTTTVPPKTTTTTNAKTTTQAATTTTTTTAAADKTTTTRADTTTTRKTTTTTTTATTTTTTETTTTTTTSSATTTTSETEATTQTDEPVE